MKLTTRSAVFASALAFLMTLCAALVAGCGKDESQHNANTDAQRQQAAQQAVQNNPHISPEAKAAILQHQPQVGAGRKINK